MTYPSSFEVDALSFAPIDEVEVRGSDDGAVGGGVSEFGESC